MIHTITSGRLKNKTSKTIGTSPPQIINTLTFFSIIETETVDIVFKKIIDNIKDVNQNYVKPQLYECIDATKNTKNDNLLSLMTRKRMVAVVFLF